MDIFKLKKYQFIRRNGTYTLPKSWDNGGVYIFWYRPNFWSKYTVYYIGKVSCQTIARRIAEHFSQTNHRSLIKVVALKLGLDEYNDKEKIKRWVSKHLRVSIISIDVWCKGVRDPNKIIEINLLEPELIKMYKPIVNKNFNGKKKKVPSKTQVTGVKRKPGRPRKIVAGDNDLAIFN